jgi:ubiquinone/menaquinone biosynthesis C-methylase UbiE
MREFSTRIQTGSNIRIYKTRMFNTSMSKSWDWSAIPENSWNEVSDEFLPVALRWKALQKRTVLDLGCGRGRHAIFLAEMGFEVTAVDLSSEGIKQLQDEVNKRKVKNVKSLVCDMLELPFGKNSFDCVLAFFSIYHTTYVGLKTIIENITRYLTESGQLFVTFNSKSNPSFRNPTDKVIDSRTIIKTGGIEDGIPHTYLDYDDVLMLMVDYQIKKIQHIQDYYRGGSSFHYFVEAEKLIFKA